ncbi:MULTISPECIES: hypothetical protein [unclassified Nocardia]|uniref:baeRF2 domain-containing protein n=1 Tax=unclassified Nocardia TaxID=2637762 RepID=UPI00278BD9C6|nr:MULTISPECIES: hypothetical protein [unclassified Nocardia]
MVRTSLRELVDRTGPFASVYFDSSHDSEAAARELTARCRSMRERLDRAGASATTLAALDIAFAAGPRSVGRCGRALVADAATVLVDEQLPAPPAAQIVRVSPLPYLLPLLEQRAPQVPHVLVTMDRVGAYIRGVNGHGDVTHTSYGTGRPLRTRHRSPGHRVGPRRAADAAGRDAAEVARQVVEMADHSGAVTIVLTGECAARTALRAAIEARSRLTARTPVAAAGTHSRRIVELDAAGRTPAGTDTECGTAVDEVLADSADRWRREVLARYATAADRADGAATGGLPETTAALRDTAVAQLFVDSAALDGREVLTGAAPTEVATDAADLRDVARPRRADEAVPVAAIAGDSDIVPVSGELSLPDGVGALLRQR